MNSPLHFKVTRVFTVYGTQTCVDTRDYHTSPSHSRTARLRHQSQQRTFCVCVKVYATSGVLKRDTRVRARTRGAHKSVGRPHSLRTRWNSMVTAMRARQVWAISLPLQIVSSCSRPSRRSATCMLLLCPRGRLRVAHVQRPSRCRR